jgi:hypothetical protein
MQQDFTIRVPDQLWVDTWANEVDLTYTYDGPDAVYATVSSSRSQLHMVSRSEITNVPDDQELITISATDYPEIAHAILEIDSEDSYTYTYTDEPQFNNHVYQRITNPQLTDYFVLESNPIPADWDAQRCLRLTVKLKAAKNPALDKAKARLTYINTYATQYDFGSDQTAIDNLITSLETHIAVLETAYPWKFDAEPSADIPKIPASVVALFNGLPEEV